MDDFTQENLLETLLELKRSRYREKLISEENAILLNTISTMGEASTRKEIFDVLLNSLQKFIAFENAIVLSRFENGNYYTLLSTDGSYYAVNWLDDPKFERAINGESILIFEPTSLINFRHNYFVSNLPGSVLLTGMKSSSSDSLIILTHQSAGQFTSENRDSLRRLSPLFERAIHDLDHKERLQCLVDDRTKELRKTQEFAEKASKSKSEFLAMMSHEVRTPLNSVVGLLDIMKLEGVDAKHHNIINNIEKSSELLLTIIDDVLDMTKLESGHFEVEARPTILRDTVTFVCDQFREPLNIKGVTFTVCIDTSVPDVLMLDPQRLSQILFNVLGNAVKFTSFGFVSIDVNTCEGSLNFLIKDSGIGMSGETIRNLFTPFTQADSSITRNFQGTGLGLAISHKLLKIMSGEISVSSTLGGGSEFTISLPIVLPNEECERGSPDDTVENFSSKHVLIVDDSKSNQLMLKLMLKNLNCTSQIADNGFIAIEMVENNHFDVIFMDLSMPVLDGISATKTLRENSFDQPIIALTAHAFEDSKSTCLEAGMNDFLAKPIRSAEIKRVLADSK
jgi:signal transduction histidine kinase/CheY-like chemotaxis protein